MAKAKTQKRTAQHLEKAATDSSWKQGDLLELAIESLTDSGDGLGRWGSRVVLVNDTVTGESGEVRRTGAK
ncbi:MAG: hypothetical protein ACFCBU_04295 [Cyanophyceae cyanobacterium]